MNPRSPNTRIALIVLLFLWVCVSSNAQDLGYTHEHYSVEQGLSDHRITHILQHSNGYTYVSTQNGFNRFDGYRFTRVKLNEREYTTFTHAGEFCNFSCELEDGRILVQFHLDTEGGSVADVYDPVSGAVEEVLFVSRDVDGETIQLKDREVPYRSQGVVLAPSSSERITVDPHGNRMELRGGFENWAQLTLVNGMTLDMGAAPIISTNHVAVPFGLDFSKTVYFRTYNGMVKIDVDRSHFTPILAQVGEDWQYRHSGRSILPLDDGSALFSVEKKNLQIRKPNGEVRSVGPFSHANHPYDKTENNRFIVHAGGTRVWLVSHWGMLQLVDYEENELVKVLDDYYANGDFETATVNSKGNLMLVHRGGPENIMLVEFDLEKEDFTRHDIVSQSLQSFRPLIGSCITQASDNTYWLGTTQGLFHFDIEKATLLEAFFSSENSSDFSHLDCPIHYGLTAREIFDLFEDDNGDIWVGTGGGGINIIDPSASSVEVINMSNGLPNDHVSTILKHGEDFWIGTFNGLAHYSPASGSFRNYYTSNGITHNEFNRWSKATGPDNHVYFGGMNGFIRFQPEKVLSDDKPVELLLSSSSVFNEKGEKVLLQVEKIPEYTRFEIPSANRSCSFSLALNDQYQAQSHEYSYCLAESGAEVGSLAWRAQGQDRLVKFDFLEAGSYDLWFKGTSSSGIISEPFLVHLEVSEFFYKTWWFIMLAVILVCGGAFAFYRYRVQEAIRMERLRTQLSSDLHDDVGSLLSGVAYQMELLEHSVPEENKNLVQRVAVSSRRAMSQMRDVIWAIDSRNTTLRDLVERMREFAREQMEPANMPCMVRVKGNQKKLLTSEVRHAILLIFKEFMTNSLKHSGATMTEALVTLDGNQIIAKFSDNGSGMDPDLLKKSTGQGMDNMKMRAKKIDAEMQFESVDGFQLILTVPI